RDALRPWPFIESTTPAPLDPCHTVTKISPPFDNRPVPRTQTASKKKSPRFSGKGDSHADRTGAALDGGRGDRRGDLPEPSCVPGRRGRGDAGARRLTGLGRGGSRPVGARAAPGSAQPAVEHHGADPPVRRGDDLQQL